MSRGRLSEVLLVEDSAQERELAIRALHKAGLAIDVTEAADGADALDYLFSEGKYAANERRSPPAMILLDLKMPKVNGLEVLERIRADEMTRRTPVIVLTSSDEQRDVTRAYDLGANSYIVKPVDFESFMETVVAVGSYWLSLNRRPS